MITSCCMYASYQWLCMVVEGCVWFWLRFSHVTDIIHWQITILIRFLICKLYFVRDKCYLFQNIQCIEIFIKNIPNKSFLSFSRHNKEHYLCFWIFLSISKTWQQQLFWHLFVLLQEQQNHYYIVSDKILSVCLVIKWMDKYAICSLQKKKNKRNYFHWHNFFTLYNILAFIFI